MARTRGSNAPLNTREKTQKEIEKEIYDKAKANTRSKLHKEAAGVRAVQKYRKKLLMEENEEARNYRINEYQNGDKNFARKAKLIDNNKRGVKLFPKGSLIKNKHGEKRILGRNTCGILHEYDRKIFTPAPCGGNKN
jgi:hypothetical protein